MRFYYRYTLGLHEPTVPSSLVFGGAVHAALELHYRALLAGSVPPSLDELLGAFWADWQSHHDQQTRFSKGEDTSSIGRLAERMLVAFQASEFARPAGTIFGIEEELRGELVPGVPDLLARLDLLVEDDQTLHIWDFKTSRSRWSRRQADQAAGQLLLYSELARRLVLNFVVLTKTKTPQIDLHEVPREGRRVRRIKRVAQRIWRAIAGGHFYPAPSPTQCPSCPFRGPCRRWPG